MSCGPTGLAPARLSSGFEKLISGLGRLAGWGVLLLAGVTVGELVGRLSGSPIRAPSGFEVQLAVVIVCLAFGPAQRRRLGPSHQRSRLSRLRASVASALLSGFYLALTLGTGLATWVAWVAHEPGIPLPGWAIRAFLPAGFILSAVACLTAAAARPRRREPASEGTLGPTGPG